MHPPALLAYRSEADASADALIRQALLQPAGGTRLHELAVGRKQAVILISDGTRLCPSFLFLPALLEELNKGGIPDERICIVVALGLHRKHTEAELRRLVGETIYRRVKVLNHSACPEDCVFVGITRQGTPIEINRHVIEADLRIATGNIEPHRLVGVSGGVKALLPGTASERCIEANHALSQRYKAKLGDPDNPIHDDMAEALQTVPIHFLFNVIVNHRQELLGAYAGEWADAHRNGVEAARNRFFIEQTNSYELVVASAGGYPKDSSLYQSIKTLQNASAFTKPGGSILLLARCEEHFGNGILQHWVETIQDRKTIVSKLQRQFVLGAHKIAYIDDILSKHTVYLYSDMPEPIVELTGFIPVRDIKEVLQKFPPTSRDIAFIPYGGLTFPSPSR
ncbi:nickel-dependent lactate racemase [Paenibacillus ginsengarvi]|uniref:Nickel-dependent lactate racemase n=2 Tax=Paenibacillus ginsengarvi TaxID=400777 RepID=A0A3B0BRK1_9BACL|nr:nickel-dependent lactate racemase [Paenibacillus ginsengarvi]